MTPTPPPPTTAGLATQQRPSANADGYRRRHRHRLNTRPSTTTVCVLVSALALVGMLSGGVSASSPSSAQNTAGRRRVAPAVRGRRNIDEDAAAARPAGFNAISDNNDNNYPFDLLSRGGRQLKEDDNKNDKNDKNAEPAQQPQPEPQPQPEEPEPAQAVVEPPVQEEEDEDPDDDRVQACGLQWDRSISCGGKADKKDVVPVCCPGYACEGEWCVLPKKTPAPTPEPTDAPTMAPTGVPTGAPTKLPTTATPTKMPTVAPTDAPVTALPAVAVVETPSPVSPSPTTTNPTIAPTGTPTASPTLAPRPTPPPQPAIPSTGLVTVPLGSTTTYTYTFPRSTYTTIPSLDANLLAEVTTSFLYGRLLAVLDDKKSDYELVDGVDFNGVRMEVVSVDYGNLDQDEEELREAGLLDGGEEDKRNNNNKDNGKNRNLIGTEDGAEDGSVVPRKKNRIGSSDVNTNANANANGNGNSIVHGQTNGRRTQQAPAFSIGRPKAVITLSGEARFRVTEPDLLVPAPGTAPEDQQFILVDPSDVPSSSTLWDIQQLIWNQEGASEDFVQLVQLAGEAAGDVAGTVSFVKIEQGGLVVPTVPPTAMPTRRPTMAPVVAVVEEEIVLVPPTDGGMDSADGGDQEEEVTDGGGGFIPFEPEPPQETEEGSTFIPVTPETSGSTSKNTSNNSNSNDSTTGIVIGVVAALVVGLAILAFFLVKRKRRLDASAELVDKARAEKIRREQDLASSGQRTPPNGSASANEDGIEVGYTAGAASVAAGTAVTKNGGGSGGGWLSSKFLPKYLSPGRATKNRPDPNGQRPNDDNSSLGSSSIGNGTTDSKESWAKRVQSNLSVGGSTLRGADDGSLDDDFSVGAESIGGKAAGPAFTGDDVENVNTLGEIGMDDDVDVTRGYDMARTETAQSTWSFSGVGRKRHDPPAVNPPNYGVAVAPQRSDVDNDDETEFSPDTRILNDDESALLEDDFDREFNRKPSDLTHISQGPGAIRPKQSGSRYRGGNLPTHNETGSPAPPPPAYSPPKKQSPTKLFAGSMLKRGGSSLRQATAPQNQPTPSRANTAKTTARPASYGNGSKRDSFDDRGMGGSGIVRSSTSPTGSAGSGGTPTDLQRKRMEARRKMQMQMEYDAPSGGPSPRYASAGSSGSSDTRYREIKKSYSTQSDTTERARNDNGETVLEDLNKLSGFLKERKEQQALQEGGGGSNERLGSHRVSSSTSGPSGPKTVSSFMKDRGY